MQNIKVGIIRERKDPPDYRVPLTPAQCKQLVDQYPFLDLKVESSETRCYSDDEYKAAGVEVVADVSGQDILLGVKEVPVDEVLPNKTYLIFSHTYKKQPYNRVLLQQFVKQNSRLVDYELLTDGRGIRVIAFGRFAGLVGAHNGVMTWGQRTGKLDLKRAYEYKTLAAMEEAYKSITIPPLKIVLTGNGRVAKGSKEILDAMGIKRVHDSEFVKIDKPTEAVYCMLDSNDLYERKDGEPFVSKHFFANPSMYQSKFEPFTKCSDLMINAIYWHPEAPVFFTREDMLADDFRIEVIADITCDIEGSVPATLKATTIADPYMGYDPRTGQEVEPFTEDSVDVMSIDNLPNELSRDASQAFGEQLMENVLPQLFGVAKGDMVEKATIAVNGGLGPHFQYLTDYLAGKE